MSDDPKAPDDSTQAVPDMPGTPSEQVEAAQDQQDADRVSLLKLVVGGTLGVTALGAVVFFWLAFLLSNAEWSWTFDWVGAIDGDGWFNAARTTATLLAIVGIGGAALVAYRRQDTTELSHRLAQKQYAVAIEAQQTGVASQKVAAGQAATAAKQLRLDSQKYDLDRARHDLEKERRRDDQDREYRARFSFLADRLGAPGPARVASVHAFAALADDWHRFGNDVERQTCVDLLCGLVVAPDIDKETRSALAGILRSRRARSGRDSNRDWAGCDISLAGANLVDTELSRTDLRKANLDGANLSEANLDWIDLRDASLVRVVMKDVAIFDANLTGAFMLGAVCTETFFPDVSFRAAILSDADFTKATFREVDFTNAALDGTIFFDADFDGETILTNIFYDDTTVWPADFMPPPSRSEKYI